MRLQATSAEIAVAATVSLIDTTINSTVATTITDASGRFILSLPAFNPIEGRVYILEAVKGLYNNRVGADAARLRTFIRLETGVWSSMTAASVLLNRSTTALAIVTGLKRLSATPVSEASLIGSLTIGVPGGSAVPPDTFSGTTNLSLAEYAMVWGLVDKALAQDVDPIGAISLGSSGAQAESGGSSTSFTLSTSLGPVITSLDPGSGAAGAVVILTGARFFADVASNSVRFSGIVAPVLETTGTMLRTRVPAGATTGNVNVETSLGISNGVAFVVLTGIDGTFRAL